VDRQDRAARLAQRVLAARERTRREPDAALDGEELPHLGGTDGYGMVDLAPDEPAPAVLDEPAPVALDLPVPAVLDLPVPAVLDEPELVALDAVEPTPGTEIEALLRDYVDATGEPENEHEAKPADESGADESKPVSGADDELQLLLRDYLDGDGNGDGGGDGDGDGGER
jgi:hypothetical protein